jgi:aminoglycoside 6'-N-acetyltransferase I
MIRLIAPEDRAELLRMLTALRPTDPELSKWVDGIYAGTNMVKAVFVKERVDGQAGGPALLGGFIEISERGYAEGCETSPVAFIEGWYVDGDLRNQGVGRALVAAAEKWAKRRGYTEMGSDLVLGNDISLNAHLALGFKEVERLVALAKRL